MKKCFNDLILFNYYVCSLENEILCLFCGKFNEKVRVDIHNLFGSFNIKSISK